MMNEEFRHKLPALKEYFSFQPIEKVWLFGSFARGEEDSESDVDLLVEYMKDVYVSLLTIGGIYMDIKDLLGREVDLVEEGCLLDFARDTVEKDKILIYERKN